MKTITWAARVQLPADLAANEKAIAVVHPELGRYQIRALAARICPLTVIETEITIDLDRICAQAAATAARSRGGRSRMLRGMVSARRVRILPS
ncbi:MAG: hypothetical protein ACREB9_03485 [Thermoplasmata archaeon]